MLGVLLSPFWLVILTWGAILVVGIPAWAISGVLAFFVEVFTQQDLRDGVGPASTWPEAIGAIAYVIAWIAAGGYVGSAATELLLTSRLGTQGMASTRTRLTGACVGAVLIPIACVVTGTLTNPAVSDDPRAAACRSALLSSRDIGDVWDWVQPCFLEEQVGIEAGSARAEAGPLTLNPESTPSPQELLVEAKEQAQAVAIARSDQVIAVAPGISQDKGISWEFAEVLAVTRDATAVRVTVYSEDHASPESSCLWDEIGNAVYPSRFDGRQRVPLGYANTAWLGEAVFALSNLAGGSAYSFQRECISFGGRGAWWTSTTVPLGVLVPGG